MKSARLFALVLLLAAAAAAQVTDWKQIQKPPLPAFNPPEPRRIVLKNGMVIFLMEDHELPVIDGFVRIQGGAREVPAAKTGMMAIYGEAWRTGGTRTRTGDQLDDFLEARAAKVETGGGMESTTIGWASLKQDFDDVFAIFLELLREPEFREDKIELAKRGLYTDIARRNDQIGGIASRESVKLAYGAGNPYARYAEYATVAAVTRQDLLDWHKRHVAAANIILGVVGDFDAKAMEAKLRRVFEKWPKSAPARPAQPEFKGAAPGVYFVAKDDVNQSAIRMVYPVEITRKHPDYYAIEVMNEVLGGGFSSRLVGSVRSQKGLAYAVGGGISVPFDHPGIFRLVVGTKSQSTAEAIEALFEELEGMKTKPPTQAEIQRAKDTLLNGFIFNFDSKEKVLREKMAYEFYGYPLDFLEQYRVGIEKVTPEDVARVARKYLHRDKLAILVVGRGQDFDKPLSTFGPVRPLDITIPPPPPEIARELGEGAE